MFRKRSNFLYCCSVVFVLLGCGPKSDSAKSKKNASVSKTRSESLNSDAEKMAKKAAQDALQSAQAALAALDATKSAKKNAEAAHNTGDSAAVANYSSMAQASAKDANDMAIKAKKSAQTAKGSSYASQAKKSADEAAGYAAEALTYAKSAQQVAGTGAGRPVLVKSGFNAEVAWNSLTPAEQLDFKGSVVAIRRGDEDLLKRKLSILKENACAKDDKNNTLYYYLFNDGGKIRDYRGINTEKMVDHLIHTNCNPEVQNSDGKSGLELAREAANSDPEYRQILDVIENYEPNDDIKDDITKIHMEAFNGRDLSTPQEFNNLRDQIMAKLKAINFTRQSSKDLADELIVERENKDINLVEKISGTHGPGFYKNENDVDVPLNIRINRFGQRLGIVSW